MSAQRMVLPAVRWLGMWLLAAGLLAACSPTGSGGRPGGVTVLKTAPDAFDVTVQTADPATAAAQAKAALAGACAEGQVKETGRVVFPSGHRAFSFRCAGSQTVAAGTASRMLAPGILARYRLLGEQDAGQGPPCGDGTPTPRRLRTLAPPDGGRPLLQLVVTDCQRGIAARQWTGAALGDHPLPFLVLDQSTVACAALPVAGCERFDVVSALLGDDDLRHTDLQDTSPGAAIVFSAAGGDELTVDLPAEAIRRHRSTPGN